MRYAFRAGIVAALLGCTALAFAQTATIPAAVDGDVIYQGVLGFTVDDTDDRVVTSRSGGNSVRNGAYEFSLAALPAGAIITGASLEITTAGLVSNTGATADVSFRGYTADGAITDADHELNTAADLIASETYATGGSGPSIGTLLTIDFDTIAPLQAAVDSGTGFFGVRSETVNFVTFSIHSLETTNPDVLVPTLQVSYVPEPGTAGLLLALGGVGALRRRWA